MTEQYSELQAALQAIRDLSAEQGGRISAREAHDAWRWVLVNAGWKAGLFDIEQRRHPQMMAFDALPENRREHALRAVEEGTAVSAPAPVPVEVVTSNEPSKQNNGPLGWRGTKKARG